jgi:uncharacterized membrane protein YphA (DoxX/SURF4 family)
METINLHGPTIAALTARVILGFLFFFQGYDAVFKLKLKNVNSAYKELFSQSKFPAFLIGAGAYYTSLSELIGGSLLILGLFTYPALYILAINLMVASFAFGSGNALWDTKHVLPRLVLLLFNLSIPLSWHLFSLDQLFKC